MTTITDTAVQLEGARRRPSELFTLVAVALASLMVPLAVTGPVVALPRMASELHASVDAVQWVLNAYNVTFAACLLACGTLADRFGRRRLLTAGTLVYAAMTALSGLSTDIVLVDVARAVQGIGSACILTAGAATLAATFEGPRRARAFGVLGTSFGAGLALGPLVAGGLVDLVSWRAVFLVNLVFVAAVLALMARVADSRNQDAGGLDWPGLVTFSASLFLLALAFVRGPLDGWSSVSTVLAFVGAVAFMIGFVVVEGRTDHPMFDLSLFRRPTFVAVMSQPFTIVFGFVILVTFLPPYFQGVGGQSAAAAGSLLLPLMLPVFVVPFVLGQVAGRIPVRIILSVSSLLISLGSLWLVTLRPGEPWPQLAGPLLVFGLGVGSAFGVMDNAAVSVVPVERAGAAAGMFNTMRITGESIAVAGAAALLSSITIGRIMGAGLGLAGRSAQVVAEQAVQGRMQDALSAVPAGQRSALLSMAASGVTTAMHVTFLAIAVLALIGAITTFFAIKDRELASS